ncbi:peptidylprolyl isomerase [Enterococcus innesii]|uniref:Foldase protein PrsA n=1 Tax=Enterococcus innesii TaxID=2839759 RepID=A0ABN6NPM8_9ENTE|nr:peptidylprolyl isomerase [Enterococcus innesii]BDG67925.1 peptidylprolyl isomerase [Enterococcus innesii]
MKKKLILVAVSAMSLFALAACGNSSEEIATMKGGKITVQDFYDQAKTSSENQNALRQMIVLKVFTEKYGDDVTEDMIDEQFNNMAEQYGGNDSFESTLTASGYTVKSYRAELKQQLALREGLKANMDITDEDMKTAWDSFHPEVEAQIIKVASEDDAKDVLEEVKKDDADFGEIAKEKSTDAATKEDGGTIKFDSTSSAVPNEVKTAAFDLKDGEISEVISATNTSTYTTEYYIVKMVKNQDKGNDMDKYKDDLTEIAQNTLLNDQTFVAATIGQELQAANVKMKDSDLADLLSDYITAAETEDSTADSSATDSSAADSSATDATDDSTATSESATDSSAE